MSIADWTFHEACSALADIITAAVDDPAVSIVDGYPGEKDPELQYIYVAGVSRADRAPFTTHGASEENYEILIAIRVVTYDTARETRARVAFLLNAVTEAIDANQTLNGQVSHAVLKDIDTVTTRPTTDGWYSDLIARITIRALRG